MSKQPSRRTRFYYLGILNRLYAASFVEQGDDVSVNDDEAAAATDDDDDGDESFHSLKSCSACRTIIRF